ncbi:protein SDA1 [Sporothrix brasiliensis 5110]|uniref:Protein SDA1 n=1 Tax=Sporothrix brasiliensis 5110 TaxID=1398154 RepID=A0A0C2J0T5_9PEZI|nr:protein SDA1 [Sporothrix brasiliensis 5110]KIH90762.1 protein SDA1 [Sporothrix brasiliensis 5110]
MGKRKVAALEKLDADLSYEDEFQRQYEQYVSQRDLFLTAPANASPDQIRAFHDLIDLLAHIADCYPEALRSFPDDLAAILTQHHAVLHPELRDKIVGSFGLLRRKDILDSPAFARTLFPILVHTPSKTLRTLLFRRIVSDLRNANSRTKNHKLNRTVQTVLFNLVTSDRTSARPIWAVKITRELWTRQIWVDERPVEVMREACLGDNEKVVVSAVRFFLGGDKAREELEDDSSDDEKGKNKYGGVLGGGAGGPVDLQKMKQGSLHSKKTKKTAKRLERAVDKVKKMERKKQQPQMLNFSALHLLHAPHDFAEALFTRHLQSSKCKFSLDSKLQILQLVTRLHGLHKLIILPLFSWFTKYLTPRQTSVTTFLASLAQAVHDQVPPDALEPLLAKIANEFVSEASAAEVASAGLTAIREVCLRQPLAMNETLLQDLVLLRKSKDKSVMMAARGLLSLFRVVGAEMLAKKDRGKEATMGLRSGEMHLRKFGEEATGGGIEGIELLEEWKKAEKKRKRAAERAENGEEDEGDNDDDDDDDDEDEDDSDNSSEWDMSDHSDDSGGWIDVSEDEAPAKLPPMKKQRKGKKSADADGDEEDAEEVGSGEDGDEDNDADSEEDDAPKEAAISKLATTTVLTPADLAKLRELRMEASVEKALGSKAAATASRYAKAVAARHADDGLTAEQIELASTLRKATKEERIAKAQEGKPSRESHQSVQAQRKAKKVAEGKSLTNQEKARKKNIFMTMGKARAKNRRSLVETRKALQAHVSRSKRGGRRGNLG